MFNIKMILQIHSFVGATLGFIIDYDFIAICLVNFLCVLMTCHVLIDLQ